MKFRFFLNKFKQDLKLKLEESSRNKLFIFAQTLKRKF